MPWATHIDCTYLVVPAPMIGSIFLPATRASTAPDGLLMVEVEQRDGSWLVEDVYASMEDYVLGRPALTHQPSQEGK